MATIDHILFPFDFSQVGLAAAPYVRTIAKYYGAKVSVLTVIPPTWNMPPGTALPTSGLDSPEHELQARQDQLLAEQFAGMPACRLTESGEPALKILEFARRNRVGLIMMPTHGVSGYRSTLLGSVTVKVLNDAKCPVWTSCHVEERRWTTGPSKILCAVDDSPPTASLMRWASEFSQHVNAEIGFLHVIPLAVGSAEIQEQVKQDTLAKLEALKQSEWIPGLVQIAVGKIVDTVTEEARRQGADLVIIGRGLLPSPLGRLRSNAYAIIQQSPCPVLSV